MLGFIVALQVSITVATAEEHPTGSTATTASVAVPQSIQGVPINDAIDFSGFVSLTNEMQKVREARRVPIAAFRKMADDPETIVLDTRSKSAFDQVHVSGAVHLNFSDFTAEKLREVIPNKTTRILIYCNNNFREPDQAGSAPAGNASAPGRKEIAAAFVNKAPRLALNIPTFITLFGYGYENIYELADQLELDDTRLKLVGTFDDEKSATGTDL